MKRLAIVLGVGVLAAALAAAPVPKESPAEKLKRLFGTCVDPDKDCRFTLEGESLRIKVAGIPHRLVPSAGPSNAPRTARPVEGDFVATVRLRQPRPLDAEVGPAAMHAGLLIAAEDGTLVYFARRLMHPDGKTPQLSFVNGAWVGGQLSADSGIANGAPFTVPALVFRIARTGDTIRFDASEDGKTNWKAGREQKIRLPAKVSVGVFASHDGETAIETVFEDFTLRPATPER